MKFTLKNKKQNNNNKKQPEKCIDFQTCTLILHPFILLGDSDGYQHGLSVAAGAWDSGHLSLDTQSSTTINTRNAFCLLKLEHCA